MTWWFHLLVRRVELLTQRVVVFERVACAGGRMMYGAQAEPLLVMVKVETMLGSVTRHTLCQWRSKGLGDYSSPGDLPAFESYDGYRACIATAFVIVQAGNLRLSTRTWATGGPRVITFTVLR